MTVRRAPAPMLYGLDTSMRWLRALAATVDGAAASLCRQHWQRGAAPAVVPVHREGAPSRAFTK